MMVGLMTIRIFIMKKLVARSAMFGFVQKMKTDLIKRLLQSGIAEQQSEAIEVIINGCDNISTRV